MENLEQVKKYAASHEAGIIIDTNILILLLIGSYNLEYIKKCKALNDSNKTYSIEDFKLLEEIIVRFRKIIVTPQTIAELSNLSVTRGGMHYDELTLYLKTVIKILKDAEESTQKCDCLWGMEIEIIRKYGFTDLTMFEHSKATRKPIITDDLEFYSYLLSKNVPTINFQYIKNQDYQAIFS